MKAKKDFPREVYLNGDWMDHTEAKISVFDRGFIFGDGIYEVTPFYKGKPFKLRRHIERLQYCLDQVSIEFDAFSLEKVMQQAVNRAGLAQSDAAVYIQITRGVAPRTHYFPENITPTCFLYAYPVDLEDFDKISRHTLASEDRRWHRCDIKTTALMGNILANDQATTLDLYENMLVRDGYFTEGSHTNIFFVKNGVVFTHPEGPHILSGITRQVVLDLCSDLGIKLREEAVHLDELVEVDEIFLTGTTTQIATVSTVNSSEKEIYKSHKMKITSRLQQEFFKLTRG